MLFYTSQRRRYMSGELIYYEKCIEKDMDSEQLDKRGKGYIVTCTM